MSALKDLKEYLGEGETVEGIVFGSWGWGGHREPFDVPVPPNVRGKVLTLEQAAPYMDGWSFYGGFGAPKCYAVYVWTTSRVIWVTQYDGATDLDSAPRNPMEIMPDMSGQ